MTLIRVTVEKEVKYITVVCAEVRPGKDINDAKDAAIDYAKRLATGWEQTDVSFLTKATCEVEPGCMVNVVV